MKTTVYGRVWTCLWVFACVGLSGAPAMAGQLEDLLLENKQISIDQWVKLKAEEEKREAKALEESRGVGDVPVRERWYEKISIRGYAQLRYNHTINNELLQSNQGDRSISGNNEFFLRRARVIISGQPHERVFVYIQPEFAGLVNGVEQVATLRDFYSDLFLTENKEWRIRAGLSKVPYGFENIQSSQNRLALDRNDALNSGVLNERDLGFFLYYAPTSVRERFRRLVDSGLKGSGDYGMLGIGVYNGQGVNVREQNKNKHMVFHSAYPFEFPNGQIVQVGMDAYTGQFNVSTTPVVPASTLNGDPVTPRVTNGGNYLDERVAWHAVLFPQPFGLQAEYTLGRGPELNEARTDVVLGTIRGGYVQAFYKYQCDLYCQSIIPFIRWQEYYGGRKFEANAPRNTVRELEFGLEYQFNRALELTVMYTWTQRTSSDATQLPVNSCSAPGSPVGCTQTPYQLQTGNLLRFQLQWNF
ncbi:porin [Nitrospira sp. NS4]|uniref:porin n=1 Tax=Nitrospira sp. NS4 TaxID=3414498 RepID=UPI003C2D0B3A